VNAQLQDRAEQAARSLYDSLPDAADEGLARLQRRALALGWLHGYNEGNADGIEYAAQAMQEVLDRQAS
jgi:hypothetical protein